jgi:DNA-binding CsgD family transcriptional regulator
VIAPGPRRARAACSRRPPRWRPALSSILVGRAVELGLTLAERWGDRYFSDRVIALHLTARVAMAPEVARRILGSPASPVVDDYLAASARIEGLSAEARQHLGLVGYLREAVTGDLRAHDAAIAARDALRHAILSRTSASAPTAAPDPWSVLVDESWLLLDQFDHGGRRYVVACKRLPSAAPSEGLDEQERKVAALLARGEANKSIAYELNLSRSRAANIVTEIKRKLGVASRSEAVMLLRWAYAARNPSA